MFAWGSLQEPIQLSKQLSTIFFLAWTTIYIHIDVFFKSSITFTEFKINQNASFLELCRASITGSQNFFRSIFSQHFQHHYSVLHTMKGCTVHRSWSSLLLQWEGFSLRELSSTTCREDLDDPERTLSASPLMPPGDNCRPGRYPGIPWGGGGFFTLRWIKRAV